MASIYLCVCINKQYPILGLKGQTFRLMTIQDLCFLIGTTKFFALLGKFLLYFVIYWTHIERNIYFCHLVCLQKATQFILIFTNIRELGCPVGTLKFIQEVRDVGNPNTQ